MQNQWTIFEKIIKDNNFDPFGAQSFPKIGESEADIHHTYILAMSMWSNTDMKPVNNFREYDQRKELLFILGPKMATKLGLQGPYYTHL